MKRFGYILILFFASFTALNAQCWDTTRVPLVPAIDFNYNYGCVSAFEDGTTYYFDNYSGYVYKSTDFARSFSYVGTPPVKINDHNWCSMAFSSKNIGWIMMNRLLFKSEDGGKTWFKKADFTDVPNNGDPQFIHIYTDSIFWVFSDDYNKRTTDGGNTWKKLLHRDLLGFAHQSPDTMFIPDFWEGKNYFYSVDTGNTTKQVPFRNWVAYFKFLDKRNGYVVVQDTQPEGQTVFDTSGGVFFTRDGGRTWNKQTRVVEKTFIYIYDDYGSEVLFADTLHGIYHGAHYVIHKTNDGGRTWKKQKRFPSRIKAGTPTILRNQHSYPHKDFAVTIAEKGLILRYQTPPPPDCNFPKVIDTLKVGEPIKWYPPAGCIGGYILQIGSSTGGNDIIDSLDVGDTLQWYPFKALPFGKPIFVSIRPYNDGGLAPKCKYYQLPTQSCTLETKIDTLLKAGTSYKGIVYQQDTILLEKYKSKQGCDSVVKVVIDVLTSNQEILAATQPSLKIHPNPSSDMIQVEVKNIAELTDQNTFLVLSDMTGKELQRFSIQQLPFTSLIQLGQYPGGVYLLQVEHKGTALLSEKVVFLK